MKFATTFRISFQALTLSVILPTLICDAQDSPPLTAQEETKLIQSLRSDAPVDQKSAACALLKRSTTPEAVEALAAQLANPALSHSARYALESLPPPAGTALTSALEKVGAAEKIGIIQSLGVRREPAAVTALKALIKGSDQSVVSAAARTLGQIGGDEAAQVLSLALEGAEEPIRSSIADALLIVADRFLASGESAPAFRAFSTLHHDIALPGHLRQAAFAGLVVASGAAGLELMTKALAEGPDLECSAAMPLVRTFEAPGATESFAALLPRLSSAGQVALLGQLAQRGDPLASEGATSLLESQDVEVRIAALNALAVLGDASVVSRLGQIAAQAKGTEQGAARLALARLTVAGVGESIASGLVEASPAVRAEFARALAERRETEACGTLFKVAEAPDNSTAAASLQALGMLIREAQLSQLIRVAAEATSDIRGQAAAEAVNTAVQRFLQSGETFKVQSLLEGIAHAPPSGQVRLLPVLGGLVDAQSRAFLTSRLQSSETAVRSAAIRTICDSLDPDLLPTITSLACSAAEPQVRRIALAGVARLWAQEEPRASITARLCSAEKLFSLTLSEDETRLLLAGLAHIHDPRALTHAERTLEKAGLRNESARALIGIASALKDVELSQATLQTVLAAQTDDATRQAADIALREIRSRAAHVVLWQAAGPYRVAEKNHAALFDVPFPPEDKPKSSEVQWTQMPAPNTPGHPYALNFLKMYGGEQCVAYARTRVYSATSQRVILEIASDDGVKAWVNGQLVHANNTARPWEAAVDKANAELKAGWNTLLVKVTQNNLGWEFSLRVITPEGGSVPGFKTSLENW